MISRQQGAAEAAQDPNNPASAGDVEQAILNDAKKAGGAVMQFDPNASPEEKAAQARSHVPPGFHHHRKPKAAALATDIDDGSAPASGLPAPSKAGILPPSTPATAAKEAKQEAVGDESDWGRVGGAPRFGIGDDDDDGTTMLDHETFLEGKLEDKFFGDWYHNTGVIIFGCLTSWVVAVLGGGLGWVFLVMAVCGTYYRTSIRRVRRNVRDDVNRQLAKTRLETDTESLEWINSFLVKFWPIYAPVLCKTIINSVDQVLSTSTPPFLDSLRMKLFELGTKPPRLEHVKTYPKADDDIVLMDWKFSFTPNDVADLTARQIKNKRNPKVVLEVRVGKGLVSKGLDVIVEDMAFSGLMRLKFKLQIPFPHIEKIEMSFLERPTIDYVCKPLGGDMFGFDINFIPGLETFIMEQVHGNLAPMMYDPNVFPIEVAKMLSGDPVDQAIGVLQVTFHGAKGLKNPDKFAGTPDPYAVVSINDREALGRTKTVEGNADPRWNETINVIISSLKDSLTLTVFDYNEIRKDKDLGKATFHLEQLEDDPEHENLHLEVMANGRARGVVQADIRFFPVLEGVKLDDGTEEPPPESMTGIAKFVVEQAKELDGSKSLLGQLSPYATLLLNGRPVHESTRMKRTNNPIWPDASKELLITNRKAAKLGVKIKDDRGLQGDPDIAAYQIKLDDMIEAMGKGQEWYNLAGDKHGRAKMTLQWKPVALKGALGGSGGYVTPIGVVRLHFQSARNLRNVETMGKSDPYVRVLLSGLERGRTVTFKNNLNPDWDEVIYVPVHTPSREKLLIEVMDEEHVGKDRSLGHIELPVSDVAHKDESTGEWLVDDDKTLRAGGLRSGSRSTTKGTLNYTATFYPTLNVVDPEEEEESRISLETQRASLESAGRPSTETQSTAGGREKRSMTNGTISSLKVGNATPDGLEPDSADDSDDIKQKKLPKITLTAENLAQFETGLLIFKLIDGELATQDCHAEVVMDDMIFPAYSSNKIKKRNYTFNETSDSMVRELEFSKITLRLVSQADKKGEGEADHVIAKVTGDTIDVLKSCLYKPTQLTLKNSSGQESKITVSLKYLPVKMRLDPSESINNQGNLRVDVLDAAELPAADRNGYSDPYCKFTLNGKEIHKTKTQKKTLHPAWNEFFEVPVRSRTAADFKVTVYDWDFGDKADKLGTAHINLDMLEPFTAQEVVLGLDGKSGSLRLKMLFKPDYVTRSRQGSSTFSGTFAAPGKVIGAPVKGVGKGAVFVGGGVARGATLLGRGFRRRKSHAAEDTSPVGTSPPGTADDVNGSAQAADGTPSPRHARHVSVGASSLHSANPHPSVEIGAAHITLVSASGFPPSANLRAHVRVEHNAAARSPSAAGKEVHKTKALKAADAGRVTWPAESEAFRVPACTADAQFRVVVKDHATFGSDDELGDGLFFADDQGSAATDKTVRIGNAGASLVVRARFVPEERASVAGGKSRRSMIGRRDRSGTPGA